MSGVTFAVVLMFMERGFQNALFDSTVALVRNFDADIVINCTSRYSLSAAAAFPANTDRRWPRAVTTWRTPYPVYIENYMAVLRKPNHPSRPIRVVGFDVASGPARPGNWRRP